MDRLHYGTENQITASGGIWIAIECENPRHGIAAASTPPRLPTLDPPYAAASVLRISRYNPGPGTPRRRGRGRAGGCRAPRAGRCRFRAAGVLRLALVWPSLYQSL